MKLPGRAFALARAKEQGPQIARRIREFSTKAPALELKIRIPSQLNEDIPLSAIVLSAKKAGANVAIVAQEVGMPNYIVAGELKLILDLTRDLWEGEVQIAYKDRGGYKLIL